ncbi:VOC family protein [Marilutibacter chinensis]|uniref:VOC family protein n=1 Tax=Marilutibacter chinensis TaxID=2912247 RepID=A0ABS9HNZ5_9GAMM|nr:VOC family protein [Lysobacter chinensis]MCF7220701.1 VOC family protein [Lysobacter chinensis]
MTLARPITPHLWFDRQAPEAAAFYCSIFPDSKVESTVTLRDTPSGDCDVVSFSLRGQSFMAISAGPLFRFNPSVSFIVNFDPARDPRARERLDATWAALIEGGRALMPLDAYPFSPRYGWVQDRHGLSWQLILAEPSDRPPPTIMPSLLFTGEACGKAEAAGAFYRSVFDDSENGRLIRYPADVEQESEGAVMYSDFRLGDTWFAAMDSGREHGFGFNEAISFVVHCRDQGEIDRYWSKLSSVPEAEQCGWCKDRFGVSWQVTPLLLGEIMSSGDEARIARATRAFLDMHKMNVAAIEAAAGER